MPAANLARTTNLFQVVADMQETMEDNGLSSEVIDAIVTRGLEILFGLNDEQLETFIA